MCRVREANRTPTQEMPPKPEKSEGEKQLQVGVFLVKGTAGAGGQRLEDSVPTDLVLRR